MQNEDEDGGDDKEVPAGPRKIVQDIDDLMGAVDEDDEDAETPERARKNVEKTMIRALSLARFLHANPGNPEDRVHSNRKGASCIILL